MKNDEENENGSKKEKKKLVQNLVDELVLNSSLRSDELWDPPVDCGHIISKCPTMDEQ